MTAPVVIYVNGVPSPHDNTGTPANPVGPLSGRFPQAAHDAILQRGAVDPHRIRRDYPERWSAYIRDNFRNLNHVCQTFDVSERTARKWWDGETGGHGPQVGIAWRTHGEAVLQKLFAAE